MIVGIDLGTTNSLVAVLRGGRPVVLPNALGERLTPSVVHLSEDGTLLVGDGARARLLTDPGRTAAAFKRDMGSDTVYRLGDRAFSAVELSSLVLRELRVDAEAALGTPITRAVVTVPAWFGDRERRATKDAAQIAGLEVPLLLNEPTAAAIAYGLDERGADARIAVLDLGGGTFDVTMLEIIEGLVEIRSTAGEARLGGDDFTRAIADFWMAELGRPGLPLQSVARIVQAAELAKRRLSVATSTSVDLPGLDVGNGSVEATWTIDRAGAERLWAPLVARIRSTITRALRDATLDGVDVVLPVGGAARMPTFLGVVEEMLHRAPLRRLDPDRAIAEGAAIRAARFEGDTHVEDLIVTDICSHSLGIRTVAGNGPYMVDDLFAPILERGTVLPASRERPFSLIGPSGTVKLAIFEGDHPRCSQNTLLRELTLPAVGATHGEPIVVRFTYDASGLLEVDLRLPRLAQATSAVVERSPGALSPERIEQIRRSLAALKTHPRELLPNATAIARAEALYPELRGSSRETLGHALANMYTALEAQDVQAIEHARAVLLGLLDTLA